jgi:hypothetical protein
MKRIITKLLSFCILISLVLSCNDKIDEYYTDPNKTTEAEVGKLFSYMLYNDYIKPTYWDYATFVTGVTAKYSQFIAISAGTDMYTPSSSYNGDRWNGFYTKGIMNQYRELQKAYDKLEPAIQEEKAIFLELAKIVWYDQACQIVDYWGDIPFTEAGGLNATNKLSTAKFDNAKDIYTEAINSLDEVNTYLSTVTLTGSVKTSLDKQDILLNGSILQWRKYANSLRLRLLMRMSNSDESTAQSAVTAMLNNSSTYPLVDENSENILLEMNPPDFNSEGLRAGLTDGATSSGPIAPYFLLNEVMVDNNDPRVPVLWDPGRDSATWKDTTYLGLASDVPASDADAQWAQGLLSTYDSATFILNWNCPGVLFTASEVSFLKAEAGERWTIGNANDEYDKGVRQSIEFYFSLNQEAVLNPNIGFSREALTTPTETEINDFITGSDFAYSGTTEERLEKIYTQKWLNFFLLQAGQAWSEVRRTGYPKLPFAKDPTYDYLPPQRLLYPDTEKSNNAVNYSAVSAKDTRDTKLFWDVKD